MDTSLQPISQLLQRWSQGDRAALDELTPMVYDELHRIAHRYIAQQAPGHTLQTTALLHEAYLRLVGQEEKHWENRAHFFGVAAQAMRHILVDHARTNLRAKRGGGAVRLSLDEALTLGPQQSAELVALHDALTELAKFDERQCRVVELRFFGGLTEPDIAAVLQISQRTVSSDWRLARAWLLRQIDQTETA
ncbi:MAG: sigma-70 family RNA polymerase sigma factor [Blastocatellia bacterium]